LFAIYTGFKACFLFILLRDGVMITYIGRNGKNYGSFYVTPAEWAAVIRLRCRRARMAQTQ